MLCNIGDEVEDSLTVYAVVSDMPVFPGDLKRYIMENVRYPEEAIKQGITGKVFVSAIIEKDGRMDSIEVAYGKHPLLKAEALRLVKNMPRWEPGRHQGELKRVSVVIPVNFTREMLDSLRNRNDIFCYVTEEMPVFPEMFQAFCFEYGRLQSAKFHPVLFSAHPKTMGLSLYGCL